MKPTITAFWERPNMGENTITEPDSGEWGSGSV